MNTLVDQPILELEKPILQAIGKYLPLSEHQVFFFGSRVRGDNFPRSDIDIDIGVQGPEPISPATRLQIEEELENIPTLYKIDLVDFSVADSAFRAEADKFVKMIN